MRSTKGIVMTDGVNRKNHHFTLDAIVSAYENDWNHGTPTNINHDSTKFLGWNLIKGIYLEPGKAYLINELMCPESEEEYDLLIQKRNNYINKKYFKDRENQYNKLKQMLGEALTSKSQPAPINCVAFIDENILLKVFPEMEEQIEKGLIDINLLTPVYPGIFKKDDYLIFAHRYYRRNCSILNSFNNEFLERLQGLRNGDLKVQIALDVNMIGLLGTESLEQEYQYWWGPEFDDDLSTIPYGVTRHENTEHNKIFTNLNFTEFGWYEQDNRQTFESEEVIDMANIFSSDTEYYGCRFVHSMLNPDTKLPNHLDGAIRAYTTEQMCERLDMNIKDSERDTVYTKLWRIDNDMPVSLWKELISDFYRDNMLIGEYFGGEDEKIKSFIIEDNKEEGKGSVNIQEYIPIDMESNDGLRIYFHFGNLLDIDKQYDVAISNEDIMFNTTSIDVLEDEALTVVKLLRRYGLNVSTNSKLQMDFGDTVYNLPTFLCKNIESANIVQQAVCELCEAWDKNNIDALVSYSIAMNYESECVYFSFVGHVSDITKVYSVIGKTLPQKENLSDWINTLYSENNKFKTANMHPNIFDIMINTTKLKVRRSFVPQEYTKDLTYSNHGLSCTIQMDKEMYEMFVDKNIAIAPAYINLETKCSKCQIKYSDCTCVKFIDDISEEVEKLRFIGAVWTNRHFQQ